MSLFFDHLDALFAALSANKRFALTRYGEGERPVLQGKEYSTVWGTRHWCYRPSQGLSGPSLEGDLNRALDLDRPGYYVGVSCPCCSLPDHRFYQDRVGVERLRQRGTYANLFSNGNWKYLNERFLSILSRRGGTIVLISHWNKDYEWARNALPDNEVVVAAAGSELYDRPVPNRIGPGFYQGGCAQWYCDNRAEVLEDHRVLARSCSDAVFLVQLGPMANILIHAMFLENPDNIYLDMGHALDPILYGEPSAYRPYMLGVESSMCADMDVGWDL
jgi:hypothetical protein